jgi:hypothetical protein
MKMKRRREEEKKRVFLVEVNTLHRKQGRSASLCDATTLEGRHQRHFMSLDIRPPPIHKTS